ncbi:MAG: hypothetical protein KDA52_05215 [Planctomycetaceae bacterium]|nr:hypothetical protein [Planctomycetaceae bacterium]
MKSLIHSTDGCNHAEIPETAAVDRDSFPRKSCQEASEDFTSRRGQAATGQAGGHAQGDGGSAAAGVVFKPAVSNLYEATSAGTPQAVHPEARRQTPPHEGAWSEANLGRQSPGCC